MSYYLPSTEVVDRCMEIHLIQYVTMRIDNALVYCTITSTTYMKGCGANTTKYRQQYVYLDMQCHGMHFP